MLSNNALSTSQSSVEITTFWPDVPHQLGLLLGILLGVNSEAAVALFATLRNSRARRDGLKAVAELNLTPEHKELFEAILTVVGAAEKERDRLAHGCYGMSESIEDGILWIETKHLGPWNVSMLLNELRFTGSEYAELAEKIWVYRKADLEAIYDQVKDAWHLLFKFLSLIRWKPGDPAPTSDARYRQLCSSPRLATALRQIREGKKNSRQSPPE